MMTGDHSQNPSLLHRVHLNPWRFDFFQLVRLLELDADTSKTYEIGDFTPAAKEPVRFQINAQMNFEPAPVQSVNMDFDSSRSKVEVNFWGLNGRSGVLPFHYSELIIQRLRNNDDSLRDFVDMINHRSVSLLYKSWKKHRPWLSQPSKDQPTNKYQKNWHEEVLKALSGLSTENDAAFNKDEGAWLNYSGFAAHRVTNASSLQHAIHHHFGLKVQINEFKGQWEEMPLDVRTRLSDRKSNGTNNMLGASAILGRQCWNTQNRFEVEILDIAYQQFMSFSPGSQKLHALYELIKYKVGTELDFDLTLKIREDHLETARLSNDRKPQLGWNTRLHRHSSNEENPNRIIKISISEHGMRRVQSDR